MEGTEMRAATQLIVVQRYQSAVYKTLRHAHLGTAEVIFDRRQRERRSRGAYSGSERRHGERRRALSTEERACWTELRYVVRSAG
jgi:hypothetical protein